MDVLEFVMIVTEFAATFCYISVLVVAPGITVTIYKNEWNSHKFIQRKKNACDLLLENRGNIKTAKMSPLQTSLCYQLIP